jgi:hypothetical protein
MLIVLTAFPFQSVRTLASVLKIPRSTIHDHLQRGNIHVKHLRWVSHKLDDWTKQTRVEMANSMVKMMAGARHRSWRYFLTVHELSFFISTDYEQMWPPQGEKAPTRARRIISTPKVMVIILW